jgi:disulfide bond formation protein DsbB
VNLLAARLDHLFQFGVLAVLVGIQSAALVMQYAFGELPCPLCLLERLAMFGVGFAILEAFRNGFRERLTGLALLFALLLLVVGARQTLLDIAPRPGHAYIGSPVLGLHMPVWAVVIALVLLIAYALKIAVVGADRAREAGPPVVWMATVARYLGYALLALIAVNALSVVVQCGFSECHTFGYRLLGGAAPPGG